MQYFPVATNLPYVIGIGFDSFAGRLYWTDVEAGKETLVSTYYNGTNGVKLVTNGLDMPEDLAVDEINRNIYFTDSVRKHLAVCAISGSGCSVLVPFIEQPRAVAIHHEKRLVIYTDWGSKPAIVQVNLYWSDWEMQEIVSCNKFNGKNFKTLVKEAGIRPMGITVAHPLLSHSGPSSPCKHSPCSHVCLPKPLPSTEYVCKCPAHLAIDSSGTN